MYQTIHLKDSDAACKFGRIAFPAYNGKTFKIAVHDSGGMSLTSYWSGGSRDYYAILRLSDMQCMAIPQNGSGFDPYGHGISTPLPAPDFAVVEHSIFCGKDSGITIHIHASNAAPLLPQIAELTWQEKVVLVATRGLKSSYAGISDYRYHKAHAQTGITRVEWDTAKTALIGRKLLNTAGAITVDGKNACGNTWDLYHLRNRPEVPNVA